MTAQQLIAARKQLGLTQAQLAQTLRMGPNGRRQVGRWEKGEAPIWGPVTLAIEFLIKEKK